MLAAENSLIYIRGISLDAGEELWELSHTRTVLT